MCVLCVYVCILMTLCECVYAYMSMRVFKRVCG